MAIVTLDAEKFRSWYPELEVTESELDRLFSTATTIINNTASSPLPYDPDNGVTIRETAIYLLMCHLATISNRPKGVSGPMTSASEGSVSTGFQSLTWGTDAANWYAQTPCGQALWQLLAPYRTGILYYGMRKNAHPWG